METLGIRNNNPCNIRYSLLNTWKGQIGHSKGFCKFSSIDMGVRAVLALLRSYRYHYGLDTIHKIISRFAPPSENNTPAYISAVVSYCNLQNFPVTADTSLNLDFYDYKGIISPLFSIVYTMCRIESGYNLSHEQFERSLKLLHV